MGVTEAIVETVKARGRRLADAVVTTAKARAKRKIAKVVVVVALIYMLGGKR